MEDFIYEFLEDASVGEDYFAIEMDEFWLKDTLMVVKGVLMTPDGIAGDRTMNDI